MTGEDLKKFVKGYVDGSMRRNVIQSAGWLIVRGHEEYKSLGKDWKVGAYEPTTDIHGDIEYLYTIDIEKEQLVISKASAGGAITIIETYDFKTELLK